MLNKGDSEKIFSVDFLDFLTEVFMKKFFNCFNFIIIFMLLICSSCVIYETVSSERYSITFSNESDYNVYDWYVKDYDYKTNYVKDTDDFYPVYKKSRNTIKNIPVGWYKVLFSFKEYPGKNDYWESSGRVYLDCDKVYHLKNYCFDSVQDNFTRRSIEKTSDLKNKLYLEDEDGNIIEFEKIQLEK